MTNHLITALKLLVAVGLISWLISRGMLNLAVFETVMSPVYLPMILGVVAVNLLVIGLRWHLLLRGGGIEISYIEAIKLTLIGIFFNFSMPGGVGGDVIKGYYIVSRQPERRTQAAMSVIADRIIGLFTMVLMASAVVGFHFSMAEESLNLRLLFTSVLSVLAGFFVFGILLFSKRIRYHRWVVYLLDRLPLGRLVTKVYDSLQIYVRNLKLLGMALGLSFVAHSLVAVVFMIVADAMNLTGIPLAAYFFVIPLGLIAMALPISPAGIGVGQAAFLFLFNAFAQQQTTLGADALTIFQVCQLLYGLVGAYFYLGMKSQLKGAATSG